MKTKLTVSLQGRALLQDPFLNKGTAFTPEERILFHLEGRLPPRVETLEEQVERMYAQYRENHTPLEKHLFLRSLQEYNRTLYYALLNRHVEEMLPIVYTPTVGEAIQTYSTNFREPRGLVVTRENYTRLDAMLEEYDDTELVVATDAEGILGIGDQGFGGIGISIGKLTLYTLVAGFDPARTLPVVFDVGTDNQDLLNDPYYLGIREPRLRGEAYFEILDAFVTAFKKRFPQAIIQWEDFSRGNAFAVLERYQDQLPSFNDDIQGTGATALAGLIAATDHGRTLTEQKFLILGAGAGGMGVAWQVYHGLVQLGLTSEEARSRIHLMGRNGLMMQGHPRVEPHHQFFAKTPEDIAGWTFSGTIPSMLETIQQAGITVLLGLSGAGGAFSEEIVQAVHANTSRPIIFALSNPTHLAEVTPELALQWTDGQAIVATGSPFPDVYHQDRIFKIGQGNNTFIFPGVGWGVQAAGATSIPSELFTAAAFALAAAVTPERLADGAVFPRIADLFQANQQVAIRVAEKAAAMGLATRTPEEMQQALLEPEWAPVYRTYNPVT
ncbi:malate dehydrogenase [Deinococcus cellulosilyticus NBRC 106333 = KACC 11606]|uniref:Malate dehydrogenase n=1 Tax=Deinococcus cellulosilyticus (strain DSM 18568 / NBRC 106333 / KACC 11606 / 5516J-15) TaxID=1223518 RepID=A0A511MWB4_DEIC1|nr:malate dehydrogenase [Deinococcus cellulosilyticus NBRC 106333 = KACC 11606]